MKIDAERSEKGKRWCVETTGAVDRALALAIGLVALIVAHSLGLEGDVARLVTSVL